MAKKISNSKNNRTLAASKGLISKQKNGQVKLIKSFNAPAAGTAVDNRGVLSKCGKTSENGEKELCNMFLNVLAESSCVAEAVRKSEISAAFIYSSLKTKGGFKKAFEELMALKIEHAAYDTAIKGNATLTSLFLTSMMPQKYKAKISQEMPAPPKIVFVEAEAQDK